MLVVDANVVLGASAMKDGFSLFGGEELVAPPLLWPEARSALHVSLWRGLISREVGDRSLSILESGRVRERGHRRLGREAWRIADELGWAKTYDAEYLALAFLVDGRLVTFDRRLLRAAERLGLATGIPLQ
ncbi:MAG: type II toxin-antitoxin system VapC family toxin [Acidimicrobiia bacterium]